MTGRERSFYMHKRNCSLGLSCVVFLRILLCPWFGFVLVTGITSTRFVSIVVLSCLVKFSRLVKFFVAPCTKMMIEGWIRFFGSMPRSFATGYYFKPTSLVTFRFTGRHVKVCL